MAKHFITLAILMFASMAMAEKTKSPDTSMQCCLTSGGACSCRIPPNPTCNYYPWRACYMARPEEKLNLVDLKVKLRRDKPKVDGLLGNTPAK